MSVSTRQHLFPVLPAMVGSESKHVKEAAAGSRTVCGVDPGVDPLFVFGNDWLRDCKGGMGCALRGGFSEGLSCGHEYQRRVYVEPQSKQTDRVAMVVYETIDS
jgi:hypothetical protein